MPNTNVLYKVTQPASSLQNRKVPSASYLCCLRQVRLQPASVIAALVSRNDAPTTASTIWISSAAVDAVLHARCVDYPQVHRAVSAEVVDTTNPEERFAGFGNRISCVVSRWAGQKSRLGVALILSMWP